MKKIMTVLVTVIAIAITVISIVVVYLGVINAKMLRKRGIKSPSE